MNKNPLISVLLPLYNEPISLAKQAIDSILNQTFSHLEVILLLDNPQNTELINLIQDYEEKDNRVITHINSSNKGLPETLNAGIHKAKGKYIVLLNNDIKVITPDWLEEMLGICQRNEVGIVGAKLLYYDKTIQHAGVVIGMGGIAGHVNRTISEKEPGYFGRTKIINDFSAVTAACLMTKKELYEKVEGLDEKFAVAFNDVDFCMKIRKLNKLVVYTPYAKLYHYESKTRGYEDTPEKKKRFENEIQLFKEKWGKELKEGDPYFNKNLDLYSEQCEIKDN